MVNSQLDEASALPERSRLLHIGPMKTGTTALQTAASEQRETLLHHGVRYPGTRLNHRSELGALMGRSTIIRERTGPLGPDNADQGGVPDKSRWETLKAEIDAETTRRVLVTHEFVSQADDVTSQRIIDELGTAQLHVAITVRAPTAILPSFWSQNIKNAAEAEPFDSWLTRLYDPQSENPMPADFLRGYEQGDLVERWTRLVGPENVTVIVVDRTQPGLLTDTFETLLELPSGTLARTQDTNRSLSAVEAEMFHQLNRSLHDNDVDWQTFHDLVTKGAVSEGLLARTPLNTEPRLRLPAWASQAGQRDGKRFAERIRASGARVIGNLDSLDEASPSREEVDGSTVPTDIAVRALTGAMLGGQQAQHRAAKRIRKVEERAEKFEKRAGAAKEKNQQLKAELKGVKKELTRERKRTMSDRVRALPPSRRPQQAAATYTTRELLVALRQRLLHRLRTEKSRVVGRTSHRPK